jgi:hypothetical protein
MLNQGRPAATAPVPDGVRAMTAAPLNGTFDPAFAGLRDAFAAQLAGGQELGAALCVLAGGRTVLDLWGGHADLARGRP